LSVTKEKLEIYLHGIVKQISVEKLNQLIDDIGVDTIFEFLNIITTDIRSRMQTIENIDPTQITANELKIHFHTMKGSVATIASDELVTKFADMEKIALSGQLENYGSKLERLKLDVDGFIMELESLKLYMINEGL